ncbi:serine protease [Sporosarcina oncorhynchi]|uniref:Serine protease n=1 Tax=Sporosarcina oncorhynchi TaxID=3056444 RepID=A0ABZ0L9U4_9BACL|nr:serine protease [Sporosarcina sp. T2O-4]WOV88934.1 serine protease [Sporosarcina sp. T2O-4]
MNDEDKTLNTNDDEEIKEEIDLDLIEDGDLTEEQMNEIALQAKHEARIQKEKTVPPKRVPKWFIWLISIMLVLSTVAGLFQVFSIPAIDFLLTSAKLSQDEEIMVYKESVVVVVTENGKGTGFSISDDGVIITNYHVIEDNQSIYVVYPEDGRYEATILESYEDIDLVVLKVEGENLPSLKLRPDATIKKDDPITFIGNPLSFKGIVNEGMILAPLKLKDWKHEVMMIQAPVYRGNSGSPVLDEDGEVIGVVFATLNHDEFGKVGLFIPIDLYFERVD